MLTYRARGEMVRTARVTDPRDLTLDRVAQTVGVSKSYVSGIERGIRTCSPEVAKSIAKALRKPFADLFELVVRPPRGATDWAPVADEQAS